MIPFEQNTEESKDKIFTIARPNFRPPSPLQPPPSIVKAPAPKKI